MDFINYLLIPFIMLFFGVLFIKHSPKDINGIYGYRTPMSVKNQDTWDFANQYMGKLWTKLGLIMLIISIILEFLSVYKFMKNINSILIPIQIVVLIASIFPVEKALKKHFDENGNRRI